MTVKLSYKRLYIIVAQMLFCCLSMFPTCGFFFDEAPKKTRIIVRFYLDGSQKAGRDFKIHGIGFTSTPQYSVTDTFLRYIFFTT